MMPVGEGNLEEVLNELIEDARQEGEPFCMLGVCSCMREDLDTIMPGQFGFTVDRDYADYIYLRSDLATLKGKNSSPNGITLTNSAIHILTISILRSPKTEYRNAWS